jgi:hypothetical protein
MLDWRDETSQGAQQHVTLVISSGINNKPFSLCLLYVLLLVGLPFPWLQIELTVTSRVLIHERYPIDKNEIDFFLRLSRLFFCVDVYKYIIWTLYKTWKRRAAGRPSTTSKHFHFIHVVISYIAQRHWYTKNLDIIWWPRKEQTM